MDRTPAPPRKVRGRHKNKRHLRLRSSRSLAHTFDEGMTDVRFINFFPNEVIGEVKVAFSAQVILPASASS